MKLTEKQKDELYRWYSKSVDFWEQGPFYKIGKKSSDYEMDKGFAKRMGRVLNKLGVETSEIEAILNRNV